MGTRGEIRQLVKIIEGRHLPGANLVSMLPYASLRLYKNKLIYVSNMRDAHPSDKWVIELYSQPDFEDVIFEVTTSVTYGRNGPRVPRRLWFSQK